MDIHSKYLGQMFVLLALVLLFITAVVSKVGCVRLSIGVWDENTGISSYMCTLYKDIKLRISGCMLKSFVTARSAGSKSFEIIRVHMGRIQHL